MALKRSSPLRIVARGAGWTLYWPAHAWLELDESEQQAVITRQARLFGREEAGTRRLGAVNRLQADAAPGGNLAGNG